RGGIKTIGKIILRCRGVVLQLAAGHVVVCQQETMRADEGSGSAVIQADRRETYMIQPFLGKREAIALLQAFVGRIVEGPKAFITWNCCGQKQESNEERQK